MGSALPLLSQQGFAARIDAALIDAFALDGSDVESLRTGWRQLLWLHYEEMCRWNPKLSLVGPGTAAEVVERHYVESLCGLSLLPPPDAGGVRLHLLDVGTGGGFPGLLLALVRADLEVVLMEPNQRKCAFLAAALRRVERHLADAGRGDETPLSCTVLNARVERPSPLASGAPKPDRIDVVTSRALAWSRDIHQALLDQWPGTRFLLWVGHDDPELPAGTAIGRQVRLTSARRIVELPAAAVPASRSVAH